MLENWWMVIRYVPSTLISKPFFPPMSPQCGGCHFVDRCFYLVSFLIRSFTSLSSVPALLFLCLLPFQKDERISCLATDRVASQPASPAVVVAVEQ